MDAFQDHIRWLMAAPVYAIAYIVAIMAFGWMAARRGLSTSGMWLLMQAGLVGGLVGANLLQLWASGTPGKTIEGGFIGGYIAVMLMKRRLGITRPTGDLFALALPAGEAIGRIACFIGGCCYGKIAAVSWAVHDHAAFRYPTQLYLAIAAAATFAVLLYLERRQFLPENGLFYAQGMLFCISRFIIEFYRSGPSTSIGLTLAQLACVAGFAFFALKFSALLRPVSWRQIGEQ
jgi:phosphatidylglycerol:prolipoprotein diacylglycerol transferase